MGDVVARLAYLGLGWKITFLPRVIMRWLGARGARAGSAGDTEGARAGERLDVVGEGGDAGCRDVGSAGTGVGDGDGGSDGELGMAVGIAGEGGMGGG